MKTTTPIACYIKVTYHYYHGTINSPTCGFLYGESSHDPRTGKVSHHPLHFDSIEDAVEFLTGDESRYFNGGLHHDKDAQFSCHGVYFTNHGEHTRPVYRIVSAKSGRLTKAIITHCNSICA